MMESSTPDSETMPQPTLRPNEKQAGDVDSVRTGSDLLFRAHVEPLISTPFLDQRRYERIIVPHVVAYLGSAHASRPHQVANISLGGFCMLTREHWTHGSEMPITLQREEWDGEESAECISVQAIVSRHGHGEVGFSIALTSEELIAFSVDSASGCWISKSRMEEFLEKLKRPKAPRLFFFDCARERPLSLPERTERLLGIAGFRSLSSASGLWCSQNDLSVSEGSEKHLQGKRKRKRQKALRVAKQNQLSDKIEELVQPQSQLTAES